MDEVSKEQIVKENDRKISFRLYDSEESPSPWLIISGNNNNNADAKLTEHLATQNTEKEENCCTNFEYFPMQKKKNLRDQQQAHNKIDDVANEMPDDLGAKAEQETMDPINKENGLKANENDASTDDDNNNDNNDNSFENLSYISEDENLGVIDDIILLPNNLYSEDEMSNSDDCIYAYRGIDFEPIRSSPEDENDFLEMDFEPDPSSEIEQDNNATKELDCAVNSVAITSNLPNHDQLEIAVADVKIKPNNTCNRSDSPSNSDRDFENRSGGNVLGGNSTTESKCMCAENNGESCCCLTRLKSASEGFNGERDSTAAVETHFQGEHLMELTQPHSSQQASNVILSAPLSMKKYTGTIPKTNRNYLHFRSGRPKVPNTTLGTAKIYREMTDKNYPSYMCKRWKNANSALDAPNYQKCDESQNALHTFPDPVKTKSNTKRSMSFPFEGFIQSEQRESNNETQVVPTCSQVMAKLQSSQSQNHLFNHDKLGADATNCNGHCHTRGLITNDAVTIFTGNCNVDIIAAALVRNHVKHRNKIYLIFLRENLLSLYFRAN